MKTYSINKFKKIGFSILSLLFVLGCQNDDSKLQEAKYSKDPNVFLDGFSSGLIYAAFSGTDIFAFQVDSKVAYNNSKASMRFDVPNVNDPAGAYAGGAFFTGVGRDLSSYNALTFWAKSSQAATVGVVGFGIDLGANKYPASLKDLKLSTVWKKYIIPIPDASKLKVEKGMFYISAGADTNGNGYSFWVDEVKFENIGTIAYPQPSINDGANTTATTFNGVTLNISGLSSTFNLIDGTNQVVIISPNYFTFSSSDTALATVNEQGVVTALGAGSAIITASLGGVPAKGAITVESMGNFTPAPTPTKIAGNVLSIFSNAYTNVPVNFYNGYWQPYQTTLSADFNVNGDAVLNYTNFNFVGIQFSQPTVNATALTHFHMDIFIPGTLASGANFKIKLVDFGANAIEGGGDDSNHTLTYTSPKLVGNSWVSFDIPFTSFTGLTKRAHLGQLILEGLKMPNFYTDNIYFYKN